MTSTSSSRVKPAVPFLRALTCASLALEGCDVVLGAEAAVRAGRDELEALRVVVLARVRVLEGQGYALDLLAGGDLVGQVPPVRLGVVRALDVRDRVLPRVDDLEQIARVEVGEL